MKRPISRGTRNIFADLGFPDAQEHLAKAELALHIIKTIEDENWTRKQAAARIGAAQPDISLLKNGQLKSFTMDRLFSFLLRLNRNIQIRVSKTKRKVGKLETFAA